MSSRSYCIHTSGPVGQQVLFCHKGRYTTTGEATRIRVAAALFGRLVTNLVISVAMQVQAESCRDEEFSCSVASSPNQLRIGGRRGGLLNRARCRCEWIAVAATVGIFAASGLVDAETDLFAESPIANLLFPVTMRSCAPPIAADSLALVVSMHTAAERSLGISPGP